jgi:hypothetical protein
MVRELLSGPPAAGSEGPWESRNYLGAGNPPKEGKIPNNIFGLQEHISPAVSAATIDQLVRETARPGWKTLNGMEAEIHSEKMKASADSIWKIVRRLRATGNANFQVDYFRGTGAVRRTDDTDPRAANPRLRLYLSPDLVEAVKTTLRISAK